jgi:hypothetical protein
MNVPEFETVEAMRKYGGSFVKALAECFYRADGQNFAILKGAFGHYWREYEAIAENRRAAAKETPSQEDSKS